MLPKTIGEVNQRINNYLATSKGRAWAHTFDELYHDGPRHPSSRQRLETLMETVSQHGWNMNRQGQCNAIIRSLEIDEAAANSFFRPLDRLRNEPGLLRRIGKDDASAQAELRAALALTKSTLGGWHTAADTTCFVTKVGLMMVSGEFVAMDSRVQRTLGMTRVPRHSDGIIAQQARQIGRAVNELEAKLGAPLDHIVSQQIRMAPNLSKMRDVPLGRAVDMLLF